VGFLLLAGIFLLAGDDLPMQHSALQAVKLF
jgi:hypothetical protein